MLGLLGVRPLGIAAIGLVLSFTGAVVAHIRGFHNIAVPGTYLTLAVTAAALAIAR